MQARLQTVVETPAYLSAAKGVLSEDEREEVVNIVAGNPNAGTALGGGIRKLRFARSNLALKERAALIAAAKRIAADYRRSQ